MNEDRNMFNAPAEKDKNAIDSQILEKIALIKQEEDGPGSKINKFHLLKDIITTQRQEISWKNEDIKNLEGKIVKLTEEIFELGKRNEIERMADFSDREINELKTTIDRLEKELQSLKFKNTELEAVNKKSEETNRMLKAALLMTVDTETKNVAEAPETLSEDKLIEVKTSEDKTVGLTQGPSKVQAPLEDGDQHERKRKCPSCGATSAFILEIDDKSHIIYQNPTIYGKKYKCGDCRYDWK